MIVRKKIATTAAAIATTAALFGSVAPAAADPVVMDLPVGKTCGQMWSEVEGYLFWALLTGRQHYWRQYDLALRDYTRTCNF